jgi:pimeloyl-ACP methyl ester carboxylesterase
VRWRRNIAVAGAATAVGAAGYALQRAAVRRWQVDAETLEAAGRSMPGDVRHHFVAVDDGGRIHVVERGTGPPVVLVHGVTLGVATWIPQLHQLARHHRVLAVGQRGHGQSVAGAGGYSLERLAADLAQVLVTLEVTGAVVVGHSMGGMVTQLLVLEDPGGSAGRVAGLVLVATTAGPLVPTALGSAVASALAAGAGRGLARSGRRGRGLFPRDDLGAWLTRTSFGTHPAPADIELARSMVAAMSPSAMAGLLGPLLAFDVHRAIRAIDRPTRVVVGSRDVLTPPRMARAMAERIPGATLTVFEGCGHMVMLERSEELDDLITRFADQLGPTTSG